MNSYILQIATANLHKVEEIKTLLSEHFASIKPLSPMPEVIEDAPDFLGNSTKKALAVTTPNNTLLLADDSGLEVDALSGAPGVFTARYAGPNATDAENRSKLLAELLQANATSPALRTARFRCVLALAKEGKILAHFSGSCEGSIALTEAGSSGFGYDSLFIPQGYTQTFAQLSSAIKNQLSHRGIALEKLKKWAQSVQ